MKFKSPQPNIEGEGFTMREGNPFSPKSDVSIEFRPGESTEKAVEEKEQVKKQERQRTENFSPVDHMEDFIRPLTSDGKVYSETLLINTDGSFNEKVRQDGNIPMAVNLGDAKNVNDLYVLAKAIQDKHPQYRFNFDKDPEGKWIKYSVSK